MQFLKFRWILCLTNRLKYERSKIYIIEDVLPHSIYKIFLYLNVCNIASKLLQRCRWIPMCLKKLQVSPYDVLVLNKRRNIPEIHNLDSYCREKIYSHIKTSFPHFDKFFNRVGCFQCYEDCMIPLLKELGIKQFQNSNNIIF
jgi:hypothetical protein